MISLPFRHTLALALLPLAVGCASTEPLEPRVLPFHVAVVPMEAPIVGAVSPGELPGKATELRLELEPEAVVRDVSAALEEYCFERVTVLTLEGDAPIDAFGRQQRLLERARAVGADLVVELGLRYDREIYRQNASTFWLNYPLFLFAGPSNWFVGDNDYYADVELTTSVYDLNALEAGGFALGDPAARVMAASSRYSRAQLDFNDRSDGIGDYALALVIPSGHLARESDSVRAAVHARVVEELRAQAVQGVQSRRGDLVSSDWIAPVYLEPDEIELRREGDELVVRGNVRLRRSGTVQRVRALLVEAGSQRVLVEPRSAEAGDDPDQLVLPFEARLAATDAMELRVVCEAGARDRYVRSYTFAVPHK